MGSENGNGSKSTEVTVAPPKVVKPFLTAESKYIEPPLEWHVQGLLTTNSLAEIDAHPGTGKTFFILDLAIAKATGQPFMGFPTGKPGTVIYISEEGMPGRRIKMLKRGREVANQALDIWVSVRNNVQMDDKTWVQSICNEIKRLNPCLLIFDPLRESWSGNENDSNEVVDGIIKPCRKFIEAGAVNNMSVVLVHHFGKSEDKRSGRGSTALRGALSARFALEGGPLDKQQSVTVNCFLKETESSPDFAFRLEYDEKNESIQLVKGDINNSGGNNSELDQAIMEAVAGGASSNKEIKDELRTYGLSFSNDACQRQINKLVQSCQLVRDKRDGIVLGYTK